MDNYKPRFYKKITHNEIKLDNVEPKIIKQKVIEVKQLPTKIKVQDIFKAHYLNEFGKKNHVIVVRASLTDLESDNIDIYELSDEKLVVENALFDKIFNPFPEKRRERRRDEVLGLELLIKLNKREYVNLIGVIFEWNKRRLKLIELKNEEYSILSKRLENLLKFKNKFDHWFVWQDVQNQIMDNSQLVNQLKAPEEKILDIKVPLTLKEANDLLKKLENPNYKIKEVDKDIINHKSFSNYKSKYINNHFSQEAFDVAFDELKDEGKLPYSKFVMLTNPPSKWFEEKFINSFINNCNHSNRRYYEKISNKKFKSSVTMNIEGKNEKCFLLK